MFQKARRTLSLQFTALVSILLLFIGGLLIAVTTLDAGFQTDRFLDFQSSRVMSRISPSLQVMPMGMMRRDMPKIRITDSQGIPKYSGAFFEENTIPVPSHNKYITVKIEDSDYRIITLPILKEKEVQGYLQVMEKSTIPWGIVLRHILFLLGIVSIMSIIVYTLGLYFSKKALMPVKQALERLDQFTQDASHELRTPLANIRSSLDMAMKTQKLSPFMEQSQEHIDKALVLIEKLMSIAKMDVFTLKKQNIRFADMIELVAEPLRQEIEQKKIKFQMQYPKTLNIEADETLFAQLIKNLLENAVKFTPIGGTLRLHCTKEYFSIENSVIIPPNNIDNWCTPFFQEDTSRAGKGFGLGLSIVKKIAEVHGWTMELKSENNKVRIEVRFA